MAPIFFENPADLYAWFEQHHATEKELWVGYYKKETGKPSITWPQSVDEALCVGWIDGIRKSIDAESYMIRFTPRKPRSIWSAVNIKRVGELTEQGRMRPEGLLAFDKRSDAKSAIYSHEQQNAALDDEAEALFRADEAAWAFFQSQPAGYRKTAIWWVVSARREATRRKRLATLIDDSANRRPIAQLDRRPKPKHKEG